MNTNCKWHNPHMAYIGAELSNLEAYLLDWSVDKDEAEEEAEATREAIKIHLDAFRKDERPRHHMDDKTAEALRKYADGRLTAALARWELEHCC